LWKDEEKPLPDSRSLAMSRYRSLERRFAADPAFAESYALKIAEYESKGYIRKLSPEELVKPTSKQWFLPHFGVTNPNKPGKLRVVFDASAKVEGKSLNDYLMPGPDLFSSLTSILLNFRIYPIAFSGDIKEMFLQVRMRPEDQPAQRILWREPRQDSPMSVYQIQVVLFGAICAPCFAQDVRIRNGKEFLNSKPEAARDVIEKHYMDDYLAGAFTTEEAIQRVRDVIEIHDAAGFHICNWISNSVELLNILSTDRTAHGSSNLNENEEAIIDRVLGVSWIPASDELVFKNPMHKVEKQCLQSDYHPTKREMLKIIMSIFGPLGFLAHFLVSAKILLHDLWKPNLAWDESLAER